jgi:peptidoglycan hydrolase CwlO-like protein
VEHRSHEVFVQLASLQMAKARQKRIRAALQDQVRTATAEIERIEQKIDDLYEEAGLERDEEARTSARRRPEDGSGFQYEY